MEVTFPDIPLFQGWGRPMRVESTSGICESAVWQFAAM